MPGGKIGIDSAGKVPKQLISWKNSEDPSPGLFSYRLDPNGRSEYILEWNRSQVYWSTGVWNGETFGFLPEMRLNYIFNFSFVSNENETYFTYSAYNSSIVSMFLVSSTGQIQQLTWLSSIASDQPWLVFWAQPKSLSEVYAFCGPFGIYHDNTIKSCDCPKGFEPFSDNQTRLNDWSGGCWRRQPLQCENRNAKNDWFQKIPNITLPINWKAYSAMSARRCQLACMNNCSCTAYAHNSSGCKIWEGALLNMQRPSDGGLEVGQDIYLRLAADEREISTKGTKWKVWVIVAVLVAATGLILCLSVCFSIKRKLKHKGETAASSNDLMLFDLSTEIHAISDGTNSQDNDKKRGKKDVELPLFSYESVLAATDNFSNANKLGEGGFGPVYKAWELWRDGQSLELMDSTIGCPTSISTLVRYINIGLLCVQENPADRPTMLDVVSMISNEYGPLVTPMQPAFTAGQNSMHRNPTIKSAENCSINSVTFSVMEAR